MILFFVKFILTNIIFSTVICVFFLSLKKKSVFSSRELYLYCLGSGPVFTSLILYFLLLLLPHFPYFFYFLSVLAVYVLLFSLSKKYYGVLWKDLSDLLRQIKMNFSSPDMKKRREYIIVSALLLLMLFASLFLYLTNTLQTPLDGTDALKYGTLGKIFFQEKGLTYRWVRPYPQTGFYFDMNTAPSFSLLSTWERIINSFFDAGGDVYYKSISAYFALLILTLFVFWLSKKSRYLALLGVLGLLSGFSFFQTLVLQHLDSYRIFLLLVSWIFLGYAVRKKDDFSFLLLGVFSGFAAFAHTIGAVIVIFNCLVLFMFLRGDIRYRLSKAAKVFLLIILLGWVHYVLDLFWGYGWIIFDRNITYWG